MLEIDPNAMPKAAAGKVITHLRDMTWQAACAGNKSIRYRERYLHSAVVNVAASVKRDLAYILLKTQLSYSLSHKLCCSLREMRLAHFSYLFRCPGSHKVICNVLERSHSYELPACKTNAPRSSTLPYLVRSKLSIELLPDVW